MVAMADVCVNSGECITEHNLNHDRGKVGKKQHPTRVARKARGWESKLTSGQGEVGIREQKASLKCTPGEFTTRRSVFYDVQHTGREGRRWERTRWSSSRRAARASPCNDAFWHTHTQSCTRRDRCSDKRKTVHPPTPTATTTHLEKSTTGSATPFCKANGKPLVC